MTPETLFEFVTPNATAEDFELLTQAEVLALHYEGEACEPGQKGHEATDDRDHILTCAEVSEGIFKWVDTGRIRS